MKGAGGMRGLYSRVAAAVMAAASPDVLHPSILDRPPGFQGVGRKVSRIMRTYVRNNGGRGKPHQSAKECARRVAQQKTSGEQR